MACVLNNTKQTEDTSLYSNYLPSKPAHGWSCILSGFYKYNKSGTIYAEGFGIFLADHTLNNSRNGYFFIEKSLSSGKTQFSPTAYNNSNLKISNNVNTNIEITITKKSNNITFVIKSQNSSTTLTSNMTITDTMSSDKVNIKIGGVNEYNSDEIIGKANMSVSEFYVKKL